MHWHRTAIQHGGRTIAVIPSGLRVITPTSHESLAQEILETGGALYSEYPETKTAKNIILCNAIDLSRDCGWRIGD